MNRRLPIALFAGRAPEHTFRHSFATRLHVDGSDIRTVQTLLGHKDVRAMMIYSHVFDRGPLVSCLKKQILMHRVETASYPAA
ncbi:MAG: tyrosine-type recombinase/integrase [bacterium]|nr:tyrosine-type recombinase/integrase [bacterium]